MRIFEIKDYRDRFGREYKLVVEDWDDGKIVPKPVIGIMLTYNCDDYLRKCLKAIENQVDKVYALDNGSTDNTISILKDMNIDYITSKRKGDLSWLMNKNMQRIPKNVWCLYVNPDEILFELPKGFIGKYSSFLEDNEIYASDVRFPDFIYNYRTLFAGFDWGDGPGVYWSARRIFRYNGSEQFRGPIHYNISNMREGQQNPIFNNEHAGFWGGTVAKTELIQLFHFGKCRGIERQRGKGERLISGEDIAQGNVPTRPYYGPLPSVMGRYDAKKGC